MLFLTFLEILSGKTRGEIDKKADFLGSVNIILKNKKDEFFIILAKDFLWDNKWGGSCAGLIKVNETPTETASRTLERELGLKILHLIKTLMGCEDGFMSFRGNLIL